MSIISLFKSSFFSDAVSFRYPLLSIIALVMLLGCGLLQWKLNTSPKKISGKFFQYYLAFALIAGVIIVDLAELFFKGTDTTVIRDIFGCLVLGIIGMAVSAGIWYLKFKNGGSNDQEK